MANTFLFANNAGSALAAPISNSATSISLTSGTGALFPNPSSGQQFSLTLTPVATGIPTEIVYCTARSGDTLTVIRGQEGTIAQAFLAGDLAANFVTAGQMAAMLQTATLYPSRVVTTSGVFVVTTADANGYVNLNRTSGLSASSTTLPSNPQIGQTYTIADLAANFQAYPVTVNAPAGMTIATLNSVTLNVNRQTASFQYAGSNVWSTNV